MAITTYNNINRPYNNLLERSDLSIGGGGSISDVLGTNIDDANTDESSSKNGGTIGGDTFNTNTNIYLQTDDNSSDLWIENWIKSRNYKPKSQGFYLDGRTGYIEAMKLYIGSGGIVGGSLDIPDTTTANSFHVDTSGNTWWGANSTTGYTGANAYILNTGEAKFKNVTLSDNVTLTGLQPGSEIGIQSYTHDLVFSASDSWTVAWTSGTITTMDGSTYSISAGNTGSMTTKTYIYLDIVTSITVLQVSTTATSAIGSGKILIAVANVGLNAPIWEKKYEASVLPTSDGWDKISSGSMGTEEINPAGVLHVVDNNSSAYVRYRTSDGINGGKNVKIKIKVVSASTSNQLRTDIYGGSGAGRFLYFEFNTTRVSWGSSSVGSVLLDTTDDYHVYEFVYNSSTDTYTLYIDNVLRDTDPADNGGASPYKSFGFGYVTTSGTSEAYIDYFYLGYSNSGYDPTLSSSLATFQVFSGSGGMMMGTDNIVDGAITTAKIADSAVTTIKITDDAVTEDKILDSAVTSGKISVTNLSDISASLGTITSGSISGTTVLQIPNGAGGTTIDTVGKLCVDSTSKTLNFHDGTSEVVLQPIKSKSLTILNPGASEDYSHFYTENAITITKIVAVLVGSLTPSVTWTIRHGTDRSAAGTEVVTSGTTTTSVSSGDVVTSFNDATVVANSFLWVETTAQSGTVNSINITIFYKQDA